MRSFLLKKVLALAIALFAFSALDLQAQEGCVFISEYIEGSSNNKALEIYNGCDNAVDLSNYQVLTFANGATEASFEFVGEGMLDPGEVYTICNSRAEFVDQCDTTSSVAGFNGNDAIALVNLQTGDMLDIIGFIGEDPGSWDVSDGAGSTQNQTLVRRPEILSGNTDWDTAQDEWIVLEQDVIDSLGFHNVVEEGSGEPTMFSLQILHASDLEGGVDAIDNAPSFAAIIDTLEEDSDNTLILSGGDNYIPGPFFGAAGDGSLRPVFQSIYQDLFDEPSLTNIREGSGRADITIMNIIGFDASAVGNHEFDAGTNAITDIIGTDIRGETLGDVRWLGSQFPYLSANLDFSGDDNLAGFFTDEILPNTAFRSTPDDLAAAAAAPKIAPYTTIERSGELIGVVGATTQILADITSNGGVSVIGPTMNDMPALAGVIQPAIDALAAEGINKIVLVTHLQQFALEQELATLLSGVDIIVAGGSDVLMAQDDDVLRPGDAADEVYPYETTNADGDPVVVLGIPGEYTYVGRLLVHFTEDGVVVPESTANELNGVYASLDEVVNDLYGDADPFAEGSKGELVQRLTNAVQAVVTEQDGNIIGRTSVYLEGRRGFVRTEETNLGNLTADANLAIAREFDASVALSLKNGGGIRAAIGQIVEVEEGVYVPGPPPANPEAGKEAGDVSQLDVTNSLRFNNNLTLLTLTMEELLAVLEHGVAESGPGATPGRFPQVGGVSFTVDTTREAGSRIGDVFLIDENGDPTEQLVDDGEIVTEPDRTVRIVTLGFLAGGGDGYPFPGGDDADRLDLDEVLTDPGNATFANPGTEQDAFAEYMLANFFDTTFDQAETPSEEDMRIVFDTQEEMPSARVQVVHNAADPAAEVVDIYVDIITDTVKIEDFAFRTATPFLDLPAGIEINIVVATGTSESIEEGIASFSVTPEDGQGYHVVANGVLNPDDFAPNPEGLDIAFTLFTAADAREAAEDGESVDLRVLHGATDAPNVGVNANGNTVIPGFSYGDFAGYLSVPADFYQLDITPGGQPDNVLLSFDADLSGLGGGAALVAASGFLDPAANQDGAAFALIAVLPDGTVITLPQTQPEEPGIFQLVNGAGDVLIADLQDGHTIDLADYPLDRFNIEVIPDAETIGRVDFLLEGPVFVERAEVEAPFFLFADLPIARQLEPGSYQLTATPNTQRGSGGEFLESLSISFEVVNSASFGSIQLVSRDEDVLDEAFEDGDVINLDSFPGVRFNVLAETDPAVVGSVVFELNGPLSRTGAENEAPYYLFGPSNLGRELPVGTYTLTITPYNEIGGNGFPGETVTINFEVIESEAPFRTLPQVGQMQSDVTAQALEVAVSPNPANSGAYFRLSGEMMGTVHARIINQQGAVVKEMVIQKEDASFDVPVDLSQLNAGMYFVQFFLNGYQPSTRLIITK